MPRRLALCASLAGLVLTCAGCPPAAPLEVPPSDSPTPGPPLPADAIGGAPAAAGGGPADAGAGSVLVTGDAGSATSSRPASALAVGQACFDGGECQSGVCEGQGCGVDQPGHCVAATRVCHGAEQPFCSCNGETFNAPADCPGQPYERRGACAPAPGTSAPAAPSPAGPAAPSPAAPPETH